jgi:hypothetical protein
MSPYDSDEVTGIIKQQGSPFVALWSPNPAGQSPDYGGVARIKTKARAKSHIANPLAKRYGGTQRNS